MTSRRNSDATQSEQLLLQPIRHDSDATVRDRPAVSSALSLPDTGGSALLQNRGKTARRSFLRSVGLKTLIFPERRHQEVEKVIISGSKLVALTRAGVHLVPISITVFLLVFNGVNFLNGPQISNLANFFLQVAAKFHELTIMGSLTAIALDLVRCHILGDGISIGLVSSGLSFGSPSWLWTIEFTGGFLVSTNLKKLWSALTHPTIPSFRFSDMIPTLSSLARSKTFLFVTLVFFTLLAALVGPASALLFIPNDMWVLGPRTDFYIRGTEDSLWPATLGTNHTGPKICDTETPRGDVETCLNGAWRKLSGTIQNYNPLAPGWSVYMPGFPARMLGGGKPVPERDYIFHDYDTWGATPSLAVATHANYISQRSGVAFDHAQGRNRRLRDFGVNGFGVSITTAGKFPTVRTACTRVKKIQGLQTKLAFPLMSEDKYWRSEPDNTGPTKDVDITELDLGDWDGLVTPNKTGRQVRTRWIPMPAGLTGSSAMIFLHQNGSSSYESVCVTDARWTKGQTLRSPASALWSWSAVQGFDTRRTEDGKVDLAPTNFFDPRYRQYYGRPIQMEREWLDALTPKMPEASSLGNELVMNTFEALLNDSKFNYPLLWENELNDKSTNPTLGMLIDLENFVTVFLLNALSRVGSIPQLRSPTDYSLDPKLEANPINDDSFISGKMIYNLRDPAEPYVMGHYEEYLYGTAWSLENSGQRLAMAILSVHILLALLHTLLLLFFTTNSSEAWDSITELILLAYNSLPKPGAFENCSSGVVHAKTLEKKIRVATRMKENGKVQAELIVCDEDDNVEGIVIDKAYS